MSALHFRLGKARTGHDIEAELRLLAWFGGRFAITVASRRAVKSTSC
jgi:hypothetical protein